MACRAAACSIDGCDGLVKTRGWCGKHYSQWFRHGDPQWREKKSLHCAVPDCERKHFCKGYCSKHYQRWRNHGDPLKGQTEVGLPTEVRFWAKVKKAGTHDCWLWQDGTQYGYGIFHMTEPKRRSVKAHRVSYELTYGQLPADKQVLHRCDVRPCVNPRHLYVGTPMDNMQDKIVRGRARYLVGEECSQAKLTSKIVRRVRQLHSQGIAINALARRYKVSPSAIRLAVQGRTWKHVKTNLG